MYNSGLFLLLIVWVCLHSFLCSMHRKSYVWWNGAFAVVQDHSRSRKLVLIGKSEFPLVLYCNLCIIFHRFWDKTIYLIFKTLFIVVFAHPPESRLNPCWGVPWNLWYKSWSRKLVPGLSNAKNRIIMRLLALTQYQRVTDGRTDRQTRRLSLSRAPA